MLRHCGKRRLDHGGHTNVVHADNRHILGDAQPHIVQRVHNHKRLGVTGAEDGVGQLPLLCQLTDLIIKTIAAAAFAQEVLLPFGQTAVRKRLAVAAQTLTVEQQLLTPADDGNALMADARQIARGIVADLEVVGGDGIHLADVAFLKTVDQHKGVSFIAQAADVRGVAAQRADDKPVDPALLHGFQIGFFNGGVLVGVAQKNGHSVFARLILHAAGQLGEHQVLDGGNHQANRIAAPHLQALCQRVGLVVGLADGFGHDFSRFLVDIAFAVQHAGNRAYRHTCYSGDLLEIHRELLLLCIDIPSEAGRLLLRCLVLIPVDGSAAVCRGTLLAEKLQPPGGGLDNRLPAFLAAGELLLAHIYI